MISNAVCHRSYLTPGKIQVALFDDRLEITSPGMLDSELTIEKMKTGLSKIRNKGIAAVFSYMNVIEAWGTGIPKMFREAKEYGLREPELIDLGSDFRIKLYRKEAVVDTNGVIDPKSVASNSELTATESATNKNLDSTNCETNRAIDHMNTATKEIDETESTTDEVNTALKAIKLSEKEQILVSALRENMVITQKQLHELTGIALGTIKRILPRLQDKGVIERVGNKRSGRWIVRK